MTQTTLRSDYSPVKVSILRRDTFIVIREVINEHDTFLVYATAPCCTAGARCGRVYPGWWRPRWSCQGGPGPGSEAMPDPGSEAMPDPSSEARPWTLDLRLGPGPWR